MNSRWSFGWCKTYVFGVSPSRATVGCYRNGMETKRKRWWKLLLVFYCFFFIFSAATDSHTYLSLSAMRFACYQRPIETCNPAIFIFLFSLNYYAVYLHLRHVAQLISLHTSFEYLNSQINLCGVSAAGCCRWLMLMSMLLSSSLRPRSNIRWKRRLGLLCGASHAVCVCESRWRFVYLLCIDRIN